MCCALVVLNQAAPELLVSSGNNSCMGLCDGLSRMEMWVDPEGVDPAEASRKKLKVGYGGLSTVCASRKAKKALAAMAVRSQSSEDKENVDPRAPFDRRTISMPSWHPRYPLQDITALMHSLQCLEVDNGNVMAHSGGSDSIESKKGRPVLPAPCNNTNNKNSQTLRMRFR